MSYYMISGRRALRGFGQDLNMDPYAGMPCKAVPLTAGVTGATGSGQLCYYAGTCGDPNALRQALSDLGFGPINASTPLTAAGGPLAKAAAKYGVPYAAGAAPSADLCVAILNSWHAASTNQAVAASRFTSTTAGLTKRIAPPSTKATCVGECLYWDGVEQKCFTVTTGKCATTTTAVPRVGFIPAGGSVPGAGTPGVPLLTIPPDAMCVAQGGQWDAANGVCVGGGAGAATAQQAEIACKAQGGVYDPSDGGCYAPQQQQQGWWASQSDGTKYAIIGGAVVAIGAIGAGIYFATRKPRAKANIGRRGLKPARRKRWDIGPAWRKRYRDIQPELERLRKLTAGWDPSDKKKGKTKSRKHRANPRRGHLVVKRAFLPRQFRFGVEQYLTASRSPSGKALWRRVAGRSTASIARAEAEYYARAWRSKSRVIDGYTGRVVASYGKKR